MIRSKPPGPFVEVVGTVRGEIRESTAGPHVHPVLVLPAGRCPDPRRAVAVIDMAAIGQAGQGALQLAALMQVPLGEVDMSSPPARKRSRALRLMSR